MMMMMRSVVVLSVCVLVSTLFVSTGITAELMCIQGGVVPDCNDVSLGLEAIWDSSSCRFVCPTKCPNGDAFRNCQTSGCSTMRCMAGTTCRNDRCVKGKNQCVGTCVPNPTSPPPPPTVAPTQCAFGTTIQELRSNADFEISKPKVVHTVSSAASLLPSSQAQLLGGVDGFSTLTDLFSFVEDGKIYQENVWYKPTSEMYVLYTYSAGENNHGWINPASESYRAVRIGDESMYECRVQKDEPVCASCAAMLCLTGTTCIENNGCGTCEAIQTTKAPTTDTPTSEPRQCFTLGAAVPPECPKHHVWDPTICKFACCPKVCPAECEFGCNDKCECSPPRLGETVRTISFYLSVSVKIGGPIPDVRMVVMLEDLMREIATSAGISSSSLVIYNKDFVRVSGNVNSKSGKWLIKIGFRAIQHPEGDERAQFVRELKKIFGKVPTITTDEPMAHVYDAQNSLALFMEQEQTITEAKEFYEFQTCKDGRTITADKQCEAVTFAATATSSSTSIPIVAIIAPIIAGIVLIAIIATVVLIVRRRRADTVKTMENIARHTADIEINPAIAAAQVEGTERV